jgi:hypothetical protein
MTNEQEFEALKASVLKKYADYSDAVKNTAITDLKDLKKRRRLIETFTLSVEANIAYRKFIYKYNITEEPIKRI